MFTEEVILKDQPKKQVEEISELLSRIRDDIMLTEEKGQGYVSLVYRYSPEVTGILLRDETLRKRAEKLLLNVQPVLESLFQGRPGLEKPVLTEEWIEEAEAFLEGLKQYASPELRKEIEWWKGRLPGLKGKTAEEVWKGLPLRPVEPSLGVEKGAEYIVLGERGDGYSRLLSRIRDEVMLIHRGGEVYVGLVYRYTPEVAAMLLRDGDLRAQAKELMGLIRPGLEDLVEGRGEWRVNVRVIWRASKLMREMERQASPDLAREIRWWRRRIWKWVGKTPEQIWRELLAEPRVRLSKPRH